MQNILIAGGAGFIGSNLCKKLLSEGYEVTCVDNFITGNRKNIEELEKNPNFHFIEFDITQELSTLNSLPRRLASLNLSEQAGQLSTLNYIIHLASPASPNAKSPKSYVSFPIETMMVNSIGTNHLLELAKQNGSVFLFASTSEVYGDPEVSPQPETYVGHVNPVGIRSVYDEAKRFGEALTMAYVRKHKLNCRIIRIFNTYGPKMQRDDGRVVSNFINQALENKPITIYGKGEQTRSFCYVDDMVNGIIEALFSHKAKGEVINLGNPEEKTIQELATMIKDLCKSSSGFIYENLPEDDPKMRNPDIKKAKELLGWEPKVDLEDGLGRTIEYYKSV